MTGIRMTVLDSSQDTIPVDFLLFAEDHIAGDVN